MLCLPCFLAYLIRSSKIALHLTGCWIAQPNQQELKLSPPIRKAILAALSERDETAEICRDKDGNPEPDPELRDTENVPLKEDIWTFFEREVKPHVPDAWINAAIA